MSRPDATSKLQELRAAAERIGATLVDLELDTSRQTLDASALSGATAERWAAARQSLTELWRRQGLLEAMLERAGSARGPALADLVFGRSIELAGPDVPITQRALLAGDAPGERCTPDQLLSSMSALFDAVKDALGAITRAWDVLLPKLDEARRRLGLARALAHDLGAASNPGLDDAEDAVRQLAERSSSDPLSVPGSQIDAQLDALEELLGALERDAELKLGLDVRVRAAHALLSRIEDAIAAAQAATAVLEVKIAGAIAPTIPPAPDDLANQLEGIVALAHRGEWGTARTELERWTTVAEERLHAAEQASAAAGASIETRNDFRALLDAYVVKAKRTGLIEDPEVAAIFEAARDELYTAPTDLARAAELIRTYQQALTGVGAAPEVMP